MDKLKEQIPADRAVPRGRQIWLLAGSEWKTHFTSGGELEQAVSGGA